MTVWLLFSCSSSTEASKISCKQHQLLQASTEARLQCSAVGTLTLTTRPRLMGRAARSHCRKDSCEQ